MNDICFTPKQSAGRGKRLLKKLIWSAAGSCALGGLYPGKIHDHWLRIEYHDMLMPRLGKEFDGARIAHISDLHSSPLVLNRYLRQCVQAINRLNVDFVAVTGDFITGTRFYARRVANLLKELTPNVATLACLGNHDYGVFHPAGLGNTKGLADYLAEQLSRADIFIMLNESRVFKRGHSSLQFVGIEDYWTSRYNPGLAFEDTVRHVPTVALVHNPDAARDAVNHGADWVLSGHTHGTAIKANTRLQRMVMPVNNQEFHAGRYHLGEHKHLYVTRGIGYGRRRHINSRPEITVFTMRDAGNIQQA